MKMKVNKIMFTLNIQPHFLVVSFVIITTKLERLILKDDENEILIEKKNYYTSESYIFSFFFKIKCRKCNSQSCNVKSAFSKHFFLITNTQLLLLDE